LQCKWPYGPFVLNKLIELIDYRRPWSTAIHFAAVSCKARNTVYKNIFFPTMAQPMYYTGTIQSILFTLNNALDYRANGLLSDYEYIEWTNGPLHYWANRLG